MADYGWFNSGITATPEQTNEPTVSTGGNLPQVEEAAPPPPPPPELKIFDNAPHVQPKPSKEEEEFIPLPSEEEQKFPTGQEAVERQERVIPNSPMSEEELAKMFAPPTLVTSVPMNIDTNIYTNTSTTITEEEEVNEPQSFNPPPPPTEEEQVIPVSHDREEDKYKEKLANITNKRITKKNLAIFLVEMLRKNPELGGISTFRDLYIGITGKEIKEAVSQPAHEEIEGIDPKIKVEIDRIAKEVAKEIVERLQ